MNLTQSISTCFSKYVTFSGRASRSELWWFILFVMIGSTVAGSVDSMIFHPFGITFGETSLYYRSGVFGSIFALATFLPSLAVDVRRLHDLDKSGWWLLIGLIPLIGFIVLLIWFISKGTAGDNKYGSNPLA